MSLRDFLHMGGYGGYVWASYGLSALVLAGGWVWDRVKQKRSAKL